MINHRVAATTRSISVLLIVLSVAYAVEPLLSSGVGRLDLFSLALTLGGLAVFCAILVRVLWRGTQATGDEANPWLLVVAGIIAVAMYLRFGPALSALPAVFAGAAAFLLSRWRAVAVVLLTAFSLVMAIMRHDPSLLQVVDLLGRALIVMAVVFAVGRVVVLTGELERNRTDLARMAVLEERLRFARDLHDLLGHSLSVIALKGDVAARITARDPVAATAQMAEVVEIARHSVGDVRGLVDGYRRPSLEGELGGAVSVLEAAGLRCTADEVPADLTERVQDVLGWVVREAVTNLLRHSDATRCAISFRTAEGRVLLDIVNDGASARPALSSGRPGRGLQGLRERLTAVGGELVGELRPGGTYRLRATVPTDASRAPTADGPHPSSSEDQDCTDTRSYRSGEEPMMGLFGKKDDDRKPPLANVIGSKGKGGWFGRKQREERAERRRTEGGRQNEGQR